MSPPGFFEGIETGIDNGDPSGQEQLMEPLLNSQESVITDCDIEQLNAVDLPQSELVKDGNFKVQSLNQPEVRRSERLVKDIALTT